MNESEIDTAVKDGDWLEIFLSPYVSGDLTAALFVLLLFGGSIIAIYQWSRSVALTATWLVLTAPLVIAFAPGILARIVALVLVLAAGISLYTIYQSRW